MNLQLLLATCCFWLTTVQIHGASLAESCNDNSICSVPGSLCGTDGLCHCGTDTPRQTDDGFCANDFSTVGESCSDTSQCMTFVTDCTDNVCTCMDGFREATLEEIYARPDWWMLQGKCREVGYSLPKKPVSSLKVSDSCDSTDTCPGNAACLSVGCLDKLCVCQNKTQPNEDKSKCLPVIDLGKNCSGEGVTCTKRAECSDGLCVCQSGYLVSDDGTRCKEQSPYAGEVYALLGEFCDDINVFCEDGRKQRCNKETKKCECKPGTRPVDETEFFSLPIFTECVPEDFFIGNPPTEGQCIKGVVDLGQKCYSNVNCPQNALCALVGCEKKCKCKNGTITSKSFQSCLKVTELGQKCNGQSECGTKYSYCKSVEDAEGGVCTCQPGYFNQSTICKRVAYSCTTCIKNWATLGEACGGDGVRCDDDLVCNTTTTTCKCNDGYRVATLEERKVFILRGYCIRNELKIEYSKEEYQKNCVTTAAPTTLSTPTSSVNATTTTTPTSSVNATTTATPESSTVTSATTETPTTTTNTTTTDNNVTSTATEPTTTTTEPTTTTTDNNVTSTATEPTTTTTEPTTTTTDNNVTSTATEPTTTSELVSTTESTTIKTESTTTTPEPVVTTESPTTKTEPTATKTESTTTKTESTTTTTEPTTTTTESTTTTTAEITTTVDPTCLKEDNVICIIADILPAYQVYVNKKNCPHISGDCPVDCDGPQPELCARYPDSNCERFPSFNRTCLKTCHHCPEP